MKSTRKLKLLVTGVTIILAGCATQPLTGTSYQPGQTRSVETVQLGTVVGVTQGSINAKTPKRSFFSGSSTQDLAGAGAGGLAGAVIGSDLGGGKGKLLAEVLGAIGGAAAGQRVTNSAGTRKAITLTIKLNAGKCHGGTWLRSKSCGSQTIAVTQQVGKKIFSPGEKVEVLTGGDGTVRVIPAPPSATQAKEKKK